jgi:type I restriction enzyme S subunit
MKAGWQLKTLGEVCGFQRGLTYSKGDEVESSNNIVLRANNIDVDSNLLNLADLKFISDKVTIPETKIARKGSLLICTASGSKNHLGKVAYIDDDYGYAFGGFMGMLTPCDELSPKYLFHLMTSYQYKDFISSLADGVNINNLKFDDLRLFPVPFPSIPEQQRIVTILDQAFEGIAAATANAEKNLANARKIFESTLQSIFTQNSSDWVENTVGSMVSEGLLIKPFDGNHGEIHPRKSDFTKSGVPFIMASDLQNGEVNEVNCNFIPRELADSLRVGFAKDGDVLISHKGTIGRTAIVTTDYDYIMLTPQVTSYRIKDHARLNNRFVRYLFISPYFQKQFLRGAEDGSTRAYIGITKQLSLCFRFPSLEMQQKIVKELDELATETKLLESIYQQKLVALDELKKSILHQAFSGHLQ